MQLNVPINEHDTDEACLDLHRYRALIIDQNQNRRRVLGEILNTWKLRYDVAELGEQAIAHITHQAETYDIVLIEQHLPDMKGIEVAKAIKTKVADRVKLVLLSGFAQRKDSDLAQPHE